MKVQWCPKTAASHPHQVIITFPDLQLLIFSEDGMHYVNTLLVNYIKSVVLSQTVGAVINFAMLHNCIFKTRLT